MSRIDIEELLDRFLKGKASPREVEQVETWLNQNGNPDPEWEQMDKISRDRWLAGLFNEIKDSTGINETKVVAMPPRKVLWRSIAAIAAVFALFFTIYLVWPSLQNRIDPPQLTELKVPLNQKKYVILTDGSKIWVNSLSELKYPKVFNGKTREVYLSGEAYFDIRHDASRPFIIHTGKVVTTVLGTAFNIKEDNRQNTVVVTVTRGKVSVANGDEPLGVITPNQQISFNTVNKRHTQKDVDAKQVIAWQENDIHFNNITFADAATQLEQRFKVKISFANEMVKNCRFTGTALNEENLDKILKVICTFNKATYQTKADGSIIIDGPGCN
jgi:transmembrane sensor